MITTRSSKRILGLAVVSWLPFLGGCPDDANRIVDPNLVASDTAAIVSDPVPDTVSTAADAAYISLPRDLFPSAAKAVIRKVGSSASVTTAVIDGGFDAVPIAAAPNDSVEIDVLLPSGGRVALVGYRIPVRRPPRVVRTVPPRGKTDVAVNSNVVVVFSEPVAEATLSSSSVRLVRGSTPVAGTVRLVRGTTAAVVFEPAAPLEPNVEYQLVVTEAVRDLQGDVLDSAVTESFTTASVTAGPATIVRVQPDTAALAIGSHAQMVMTAQDTNRIVIGGRPVTWTSENPTIATVSTSGLVTARAEGVARIVGEMDGRSGVGIIVVEVTLAPVASVEITPATSLVLVGGLVQLTATTRDSAGNVVRFRGIQWESSDPSIARVTQGPGATAVVERLAAGSTTITATSESKSGTARITSGTVGPYAQIDVDWSTCAITTDSRAWCWGNGGGTPLPTAVPSAVAGELSFSVVAVGTAHTCALTASGAPYCWGSNSNGELGIGTPPPVSGCWPDSGLTCGSLTPVAVSGDLQFSDIDASEHTCAVSSAGAAYCWGKNPYGQIGLGVAAGAAECEFGRPGCGVRAPAEVGGGLTFSAIDVGYQHSCALTTTGAAYCWGWNHSGALGDGSPQMLDRFAPVPVAGGLSFVAITAGGLHNCGLTSDGSAYCWGSNDEGQLGVGTTGPQVCTPHSWNCSRTPVRVAGNQRWETISAGSHHTCAVTTNGAAYCWGENVDGQLGISTMSEEDVYRPTAVAGGLTFTALSAGGLHTCGLTPAGVAYCWGFNRDGQLGNGTTVNSRVPVRVAGQL